MSEQNAAYVSLGKHLRYVREQSNQSVEEVSGAVEIDAITLERIEAGKERPSEDILLLLMNYFDVEGIEAMQLWQLANYDSDMPEFVRSDQGPRMGNKAVVMLMAMDMRTMYSDGLDISTSKSGVTLNFTQVSGENQKTPVARVGMSYDQALEVLRDLQLSLLKAKYMQKPLALPPESQKRKPHSKA